MERNLFPSTQLSLLEAVSGPGALPNAAMEQVAALYASDEHTIAVFAEPLVANVDANKFERIVENLLASRVVPPQVVLSVGMKLRAVLRAISAPAVLFFTTIGTHMYVISCF